VDKTDILRSADDTRSCRGLVVFWLVDQAVLEGVTWTARMLEGELRELIV
jgi:hypothetical protein